MDYRHTEDFARRIEAAAVRGHALRDEAIADVGRAIARMLRRAAAALRDRVRSHRAAARRLPEA